MTSVSIVAALFAGIVRRAVVENCRGERETHPCLTPADVGGFVVDEPTAPPTEIARLVVEVVDAPVGHRRRERPIFGAAVAHERPYRLGGGVGVVGIGSIVFELRCAIFFEQMLAIER